MATFGPTSDNGASSSHSVDRAVLSSASPSTNGTLTKLTARIWLDAAGSCSVRGIVYSNSGGNPSALLATGDEITLSATSEAAVDLAFSGAEQISLTSGTTYWIGFHNSDPGTPNIVYSRQDSAGLTRRSNDTYADGPNATWTETSTGNGPIDCYGTYTESGAGTASASVSPSVSPSASPSVSPSISPSASPSISPSASQSISPSASPSVSPSVSISASPSISPSASPSISPSVSISASPSISPSVSVSASPSVSPSVSPSISPSVSLSSSASPSASPSISPSASSSVSPSVSISASPSISPSVSLSSSASPSTSPSASPSVGYELYSRGDYLALPGDDSDLETNYSAGDYTDVNTNNNVRVGQTASGEYAIHQFKDFVGLNNHCYLEWEGRSTLAPSTSQVVLQIYNRNSTTWVTVDSNNTTSANTDFTLLAYVSDLTNYKDAQYLISCRVYQLAT